jgi:hypothetical protein
MSKQQVLIGTTVSGIVSLTLILFLTAVGLAQGPWSSIGPGGASIFALAIDPTDPMTLYTGHRPDRPDDAVHRHPWCRRV